MLLNFDFQTLANSFSIPYIVCMFGHLWTDLWLPHSHCTLESQNWPIGITGTAENPAQSVCLCIWVFKKNFLKVFLNIHLHKLRYGQGLKVCVMSIWIQQVTVTRIHQESADGFSLALQMSKYSLDIIVHHQMWSKSLKAFLIPYLQWNVHLKPWCLREAFIIKSKQNVRAPNMWLYFQTLTELKTFIQLCNPSSYVKHQLYLCQGYRSLLMSSIFSL